MIRPVAATVIAATGVAIAIGACVGLLRYPGSPDAVPAAVFAVVALVTIGLGLLIAWRVRDTVIGLLVVVIGLLQAALAARLVWFWISWIAPEMLPRPSAFALALASNSAALCFVAVAWTIVVFPTGRVPGPRWRWLLGALAVTSVLFMVSGLWSGMPGFAPYDHEPPFVATPSVPERVFTILATVAFLGVLLVTVIGAVLRIRRTSGQQRRQLQWVLLGGSLFLFFPLVCGSEILLTGEPRWLSLGVAYAGMLSLPIGITIGMLRHDLFDIDRVLASAIVWAAVVTMLQLLFAAVLALGGVLAGAGSPWVSAIATAACALALLPLHRGVSRRIGVRLYPLRRAALTALAATEARVNAGEGAHEELERALREAVHDPGLRVGYVLPETGEVVDGRGAAVPTADAAPIEAGGERIGVLLAPTLTSSLRRELAAASVMLVNIARLRLHLARSLTEVEASRARLIAAEDHARRRFERDLHDGAQQRLVSLGMTLRRAQRRPGDVDLPDVLESAVAELSTAIAELRRLAHGIRPSVLDDGLAAALTSLSRIAPVPVDLALDEAPVPEPAATTAYYLVAESLANAVKHADAERIVVRLSRATGGVRISVSDDGRGGADAAAGTGLAGLRDRVVAIGGRLLIESTNGAGTRIEAELPCAS